MSLTNLIEALEIFKKYGDPEWPTHCSHDLLTICGISPEDVSQADKDRLDELGFFVDEDQESFGSYRYGSA